MIKTTRTILIGTILALLPLTVYAQLIPGAGINVIVSPKIPSPGDAVTVSIESFSTNLNDAQVTWYLNGSLKEQGRAIKSFEFTAGSVGSSQTVDITVETSNLGVVTKKVVVAPADIEIIEQSNSYTPPFYKGKALTSAESRVTLIALPNFISRNGSRIPASSIVFTWRRNGRVLGDESGLGRNALTTTAPRVPGEAISIEVEGRVSGESASAYKQYTLSAHSQEILLYEDNPLTGINLGKAFGSSHTLDKEEIRLVAYPFYFEVSNPNSPLLSYRWSINNNEVASADNARNEIVLRSPEESGSSNVSISIENTKKLFESVRKTLRVDFGGSGNGLIRF